MAVRKNLYLDETKLSVDISSLAKPYLWINGIHDYINGVANEGQDTRAIQSYLGHSNIKNPIIYIDLSSKRFDNFWAD